MTDIEAEDVIFAHSVPDREKPEKYSYVCYGVDCTAYETCNPQRNDEFARRQWELHNKNKHEGLGVWIPEDVVKQILRKAL